MHLPHPARGRVDRLGSVEQMNKLFGGELSAADLISYVQHISNKMMENPVLARQAAASSKERFLHRDFRPAMMKAVIESIRSHQVMSDQVLDRPDVQEGLASIQADLVYEGLKKKRGEE